MGAKTKACRDCGEPCFWCHDLANGRWVLLDPTQTPGPGFAFTAAAHQGLTADARWSNDGDGPRYPRHECPTRVPGGMPKGLR